ncbi:MAG: heparinase II/III family protein [Candidatus Bathyarchaeia archaeon]
MLFSEREIQNLRLKMKEGVPKILWEATLKDTFNILENFTEEKAKEEMEKDFRYCNGKLIQSGFAYVITGDKRFADLAKRICTYLLSRPILKPPGGKPMDAEISLGDYAREISIVYDWIYDTLSDEEKHWLLDTLIKKAVVNPSKDFEFSDEKGARLLLRVVPTFSTRYTFDAFHAEGSRNNWDSNLASALGIIGLIAGESEWVKIAEDSITLYLEELMDEDGCCKEGAGYYNYGAINALQFLESLKNVLNKNLYTEGLIKTGDWAVNLVSPTWRGVINFHDSSYTNHYEDEGLEPDPYYFLGNAAVMFKLASVGKNGSAQWFGEKIIERMVTKKIVWDGLDAVLSLIWYDSTVKSTAPRGPRYKCYQRNGWVVIRSGWSKDAILFAFRSGPPTGAHTHLDNNSFILEAYEERLVVDTGSGLYTDPSYLTWDKQTLSHNTLLVNGKGQRMWRRYRAPDGQMKGFERESLDEEPILYGGKIFNYREDEQRVYFIGDATDCYEGIERYYRHVSYIKSGYFVMVDDVIARENSLLEWRLFSNNNDGKGKIEVEGDLIRLKRPKATLLVKVLNPKTFNYSLGQGRLTGLEKGANYISICSKEKTNREILFTILIPIKKGEKEPKFSLSTEGMGAFIQRKDGKDFIEYKPEIGIRFKHE